MSVLSYVAAVGLSRANPGALLGLGRPSRRQALIGLALMAGVGLAGRLGFTLRVVVGIGVRIALFGGFRLGSIEGGFFGKGPGEGTIKTVLPDAHTDFIFAVIAEEYGVLACLVIVGLFGLLLVRVFSRHVERANVFAPLAAAGLVLLVALQAIINMAVNVGLIPAKGITLPFISSGGSSMLAVALTMGMLLAVTRRRPDPASVKKPGFVSRLAA